jgi:hypothetical protein
VNNVLPFRHKPTDKECYVSAALLEWAQWMEKEIERERRRIERTLGVVFFVCLALAAIAIWVFHGNV